MSLLIILGPTASGKTALGIALARKLGCAVISADSRQVYAGLNIGTAKHREAYRTEAHAPDSADMVAGVSHYLLNVASPTDIYTLAQWQHEASAIIDQLHAQATPPLLVGGTMLYLDSIMFNFDLPTASPNEKRRQELETHGVDDLYARLVEQDPAAKTFVEPKNKRRIIRALEVIAATGKTFSSMRKQRPLPYPMKIIGLFPDWDALQKNIEERARQMIADGLIDETEHLQQRYSPALPLLQTMNYQQAAQVLAGTLTKDQAIEEMVRVNRRYAHRQMSWWKRNKNIQWFKPNDFGAISSYLESWM